MEKEVFVKLKGLQINEAEDSGEIEVVALGRYYEKNGSIYVIYEEVVDGLEGKIKNIIKLSPDLMEVTKKGLANTHMVFEVDKKNMTIYTTPFGEFTIGILTKDVKIDKSEDALTITVDYEMDMNYEHLADCTINIGVQSRSKGVFI